MLLDFHLLHFSIVNFILPRVFWIFYFFMAYFFHCHTDGFANASRLPVSRQAGRRLHFTAYDNTILIKKSEDVSPSSVSVKICVIKKCFFIFIYLGISVTLQVVSKTFPPLENRRFSKSVWQLPCPPAGR